MSLHKQDNAQNKSNAWRRAISVIACFLLGIFLICGVTFARYVSDWNGRLETSVAQWKMKINGISLADSAAASEIAVNFVPDPNAAAPSGKIMPGQSGYFDIEINPDGTEVSFSYSVKVDAAQSNLPNGMSINAYSVNDGSRIAFAAATDMSVEQTVTLPGGGIFTAADTIKVRFFWTWEAVDFNELADYNIVVTAAVVQYCGNGESSENAEGGQTL